MQGEPHPGKSGKALRRWPSAGGYRIRLGCDVAAWRVTSPTGQAWHGCGAVRSRVHRELVGLAGEDGAVDPDTPYWLLLLASALGGALVAAAVAVAMKVVDLRHRHDETRRDYYVAMHMKVDDLHQALLDGITANNKRTFDKSGEGVTAWERARDAVAKAHERYNDVMRTYRTVGLFAPGRVLEPLNDALIPITVNFVELHRVVATGDQVRLAVPEYPAEAVHRFTNAVRRDLGMRKIKLFENPVSDPGQIGSSVLIEH